MTGQQSKLTYCELADHVARGIGTAIFALMWADNAEQNGPCYPMGCEITEECGETPQDFVLLGHRLLGDIQSASEANIAVLVSKAMEADGLGDDTYSVSTKYLYYLGFSLGMESSGTGCRWEDDHKPFNKVVPYRGLGAYFDADWTPEGEYVSGSLYGF